MPFEEKEISLSRESSEELTNLEIKLGIIIEEQKEKRIIEHMKPFKVLLA